MAHFRGIGKVIIEKNVWIGPCCLITSSPNKTLTIGEGSVIGGLTVITSDVPKNAFMVGAKSRQIAIATVPMKIDTPYEVFKNGLVKLK